MTNKEKYERSILLEGRQIAYTLTRKSVRNINLRIRPDRTVCVSAGRKVPLALIEGFLRDKAGFILNAIDRYAALADSAPPPPQFKDGGHVRLLGEDVVLYFIKGAQNGVCFDGTAITLCLTQPQDEAATKKIFERWLFQAAQSVLEEAVFELVKSFTEYGLKTPIVKVRRMRSRWGSSHGQKNTGVFNQKLIEAPRRCLEYGVLHELVHFVHPNHSKAFYTLLKALMPDYLVRKRELETNVFIGGDV